MNDWIFILAMIVLVAIGVVDVAVYRSLPYPDRKEVNWFRYFPYFGGFWAWYKLKKRGII